MSSIEASAAENSTHQSPAKDSTPPDAVEKLLANNRLTADEVSDFYFSRKSKLDPFNNGSVRDFSLEQYKTQDAKEGNIIAFLREARSELAGMNDDDVLPDRHISTKDMEQFKIRYDGTYKQNLERFGELERRFSSALPELDINGDGILTKVELTRGAENQSINESSRNYAAFLDSEFPLFSGRYGKTKFNPGILAIGKDSFSREQSKFDFDESKMRSSITSAAAVSFTSPFWLTAITAVGVSASLPVAATVAGVTLVGVGLGYGFVRRNAITGDSDYRVDTLRMLRSAERQGLFKKN
ncbi:hypothetical protein GC174_03785 [bacterium]|nr:hypothetical protein [bacterium]